MKKMDIENLVRNQDWVNTPAGRDWRDGMLLGNGDLGSMASAPDGLEWIINKIDVFDPTVETAMLDKRLPHKQVMEHIEKQPCKNFIEPCYIIGFKSRR